MSTRLAGLVATLLALPIAAHELPDVESAPDGGAPEGPGTIVSARRPYSAASSSTVRNEDFANRPISDPAAILQVTPGLFTVQHAGGGKANQYFLRGFDIDHGTDLALSVDDLPVNMVSHAHGQGYADLHFVIPELVEKLEITKGPYAAELGDFATAGAANLVLKKRIDQSMVKLEAGSFNTFRGLLVAAPQLSDDLALWVAGDVYGTDGPFVHPEGHRRYTLIGRATWWPAPRTELGVTLQTYAASWHASGQIPLRAVDAGTLGRFDSLDPTEGGESTRHSVSLTLHHHDASGGQIELNLFLIRYHLDLFSNFTFFAEDPVNGDQIEQADLRTIDGFDARYSRQDQAAGIRFKTAAGVRLRNDVIDNALFQAKARARLAPRVDAHLSEGTFGVFVEEDTQWTQWLRSVLALRGDYFGVDVRDRLEDPAGPRTSGQRQAFLVSPKASVVLTPVDALDVYLNFGRGFHSNDARGVVREVDPVTPLAVATGYEVGARTRLFDRLDLAAAIWGLNLDSEIVWVGDEGTTEARPPTWRLGVEAEVRLRLFRWLRLDADFTWTRARFTAPTGGGDLVPLAPVFTWAGGVTLDHPIGIFGSLRVQGMSDRPASENGAFTAQGFTLVDVELGFQRKNFRLALEVKNLLNTPWRQAQFANTSRLFDEPAPVEDLHFTPGAPISVMGSAAVMF